MKVTAFHGLNAYSGRSTIHGLIEKASNIENLNAEAEICCSDVPVGTIGVATTGVATKCFSMDVFSEQREDGSRSWRNNNCDGIESNEGLPLDEILTLEKEGKYKEIFMTQACVDFIWYTTTKQAKRARVLANNFNTIAIHLHRNSSLVNFQTS